jgi:hypothetical protein
MVLGAITYSGLDLDPWIAGHSTHHSRIINIHPAPFSQATKLLSTTSILVRLSALRGYMLSNPPRILCIGKDSGLLRSRCAILTHAGYHAEAVMLAQAESLLQTAKFDLIILSAILSPEEREHVSAFIGGTIPILALKKLTFASELLAGIEHELHRTKHDSVA